MVAEKIYIKLIFVTYNLYCFAPRILEAFKKVCYKTFFKLGTLIYNAYFIENMCIICSRHNCESGKLRWLAYMAVLKLCEIFT